MNNDSPWSDNDSGLSEGITHHRDATSRTSSDQRSIDAVNPMSIKGLCYLILVIACNLNCEIKGASSIGEVCDTNFGQNRLLDYYSACDLQRMIASSVSNIVFDQINAFGICRDTCNTGDAYCVRKITVCLISGGGAGVGEGGTN